MDVLFDQKRAAHFLGLSVRTLERHRVAGTGPPFARLGRLVRYRQHDLADWVDSHLQNSTSELPSRAGKCDRQGDGLRKAEKIAAELGLGLAGLPVSKQKTTGDR
jgi:predicted DNA-binding transcriptional regulator AlpA